MNHSIFYHSIFYCCSTPDSHLLPLFAIACKIVRPLDNSRSLRANGAEQHKHMFDRVLPSSEFKAFIRLFVLSDSPGYDVDIYDIASEIQVEHPHVHVLKSSGSALATNPAALLNDICLYAGMQ